MKLLRRNARRPESSPSKAEAPEKQSELIPGRSLLGANTEQIWNRGFLRELGN